MGDPGCRAHAVESGGRRGAGLRQGGILVGAALFGAVCVALGRHRRRPSARRPRRTR